MLDHHYCMKEVVFQVVHLYISALNERKGGKRQFEDMNLFFLKKN